MEEETKNSEVVAQTTPQIDVKKIEEENRQLEAALLKREELKARMAISGRAEAGTPAPEKKEETPAEYKARVMSGKI